MVEFGNELLLLQGQRKLAVDPQGRPLWAVDLAHDPMEQRNVITADPVQWRWSRRWRALRRWSRIEWRRRQVDSWIWRHLPLHTSETQR